MPDENQVKPQDGTNPESEVIEETVAEETTETPAEEVQEETVPKSQFNQVLARAKKAEDALKKAKPAENITKSNSVSSEEVEVKILKVQGMSDDLINELRAVAVARGKGMIDSLNDPIFVAIKNEKEQQIKAQKARLGASKGSAPVKKEKVINTPFISDDEHKQLWKEARDK
jgi:hypothetical protein